VRVKRKYTYPAIMMVVFWCLSFVTLGAEPTMIKVGLESIYTNAASITLSSNASMEMGYLDEYGFEKVGTLDSTTLTISKAVSPYYDMGIQYDNFEAAKNAALSVQGVPACIGKGVYSVYTTNSVGTIIPSSSTTYVAKDGAGKDLLIFNQAAGDLVFRGYDATTGLNLTTVGSSKKYRGAIGIGGTTGITPYNLISIEEYLCGVVPCEMSASWPAEALKAQAVAARSIAIYQYNRFIKSGYNVVDTTTTQAYGGYNKEDSRTTAAVNATAGQTIRYNGKVAEALYFSTSGGYTESAVNVWGNSIGYLVGVQDLYETEPAQAPWTRTITLSEIDTCLANEGVNIGLAQGVQIVSRTNSGRVNEMRIIGTIGTHTLTLEKVRTFFSRSNEGSLKSRLFTLVGASSGGAGNQAGDSNTVAVISDSGMVELPLNEVVISNGVSMGPITTDTVFVQSSAGIAEISVADSTTPDQNTSSETVLGNITINGKGFGHGVGMSQSGAKGMAKAGFSYIDILTHYYKGITVG